MDVLGGKVAGDAEFKTQLQQAFAKLDPGTAIDKDGHLREWKYTEKEAGQNQHRHTSHLMGLYPGNQISPKINKPIFDAAIKSLNARGDEGTGWCMGWKINLWARSGDAERAHKLIRGAMYLTYNTGNGGGWGGGIYENLLDAHTPYQIDGNFGTTSGIAEMLLQSHTDTIDILPTLPSAWTTGKVKGLRAVGNFEVDIDWENMKPTKIHILSVKGQECRLSYPFIKNARITDKAGTVITPTILDANRVIFPTTAGDEYNVEFKSTLAASEISVSSTVNGTASTSKTITVNAGDNVVLLSTATVNGQRYWTGPNDIKVSTNNVTLNAIKTYQMGKYYIAFVGTEGNVSKDSIEVKVNGQGAFANVSIPGAFQAENYDFGGEGVAFHATDATNAGNSYRTDGIDIYSSASGRYIALNDGEWTRYTVNSTRNAKYKISLSARANAEGAKIEVLVDGVSSWKIDIPSGTSDFNQIFVNELKSITTGSHTITLKATGNVLLSSVDFDHYYTINTLPDGFYYFRVNGKNWTYSSTLTDKTKPTFQAATTADNQVWQIKKDGTRYMMTTKSGERYINEQTTFGANPYYASWNTYTIYFDGANYAFQNGGNSGTNYWKFDGTNVTKVADPGYPTGFDFELVPVVLTGIDQATSNGVLLRINKNEIQVSAPKQVMELRLISITGKIVEVANGDHLHISRIPAGAYLLAVKLQGGTVVMNKVVI